MTDARHDELPGETVPSGQRPPADPDTEPVAPPAEASDLEVSEADAWEQVLPADRDAPGRPSRRTPVDQAVPEADAWEQSLPVDMNDDY